MTSDRCYNCKHYFGDLSCLAFEKIPSEIILGKNPHTKPLKNQDNSLVFVNKNISKEEYEKILFPSVKD